jgi:hypothetical protein
MSRWIPPALLVIFERIPTSFCMMNQLGGVQGHRYTDGWMRTEWEVAAYTGRG